MNRVVFDINVFIDAVLDGHLVSPLPTLPPRTANPYVDCLGIVNNALDWSLVLSPHILETLQYVLVDKGWEPQVASAYCDVLVDIAEASGGGVIQPNVVVTDCRDNEDNRILELVASSRAQVLVTSDQRDLLSMHPWRNVPIMSPADFRSRVEAARRGMARR